MQKRTNTAILFILLISFLLPLGSYAQTPVVEKSKEKVLIDGQIFYVHTVKPGETVYSICKVYNISPKDLSRENPAIIPGLNAGMVLKIPEILPGEEPLSEGRDYEKYYYHVIENGETVYSISKKYNVDAQAVMEANPGLDINDISVGTEIKVPKIRIQEEKKEEFYVHTDRYFYYQVSKGETFSTIARKFGVSYRSIKRANRKIFDKILQPGDWIRIPRNRRTEPFFGEQERDSIPVPEPIPEICSREMPEYFGSGLKVGVMLPFYLEENKETTYVDSSRFDRYGKRIYRTVDRGENWIFPRSYGFLEFYQGLKMAARKLGEKGLDVELYSFDTGQDPNKVREVIEMGFLDDMDLIIGPVFSMNVDVFSEYTERLKMPVVSPFVAVDSLTDKNPGLFQVKPSVATEGDYISMLVSHFNADNIVLVHPVDSITPAWAGEIRSTLLDSLSKYQFIDDIMLKEVVFSERRRRHDTINEIGDALLRDSKNVVVVLSKKETFVSASLAKLNELAKEYDLKVVGFPEWQKFKNIEVDYFHDMGIYIPSSYYLDYSRKNVKDFVKSYRDEFRTEPVPFSFAWTGYDVAWYFLSGIAMYGESFIDCTELYRPDLLASGYWFRKKAGGKGFVNKNMYLLQYKSAYKLEPYSIIDPLSIRFYWE